MVTLDNQQTQWRMENGKPQVWGKSRRVVVAGFYTPHAWLMLVFTTVVAVLGLTNVASISIWKIGILVAYVTFYLQMSMREHINISIEYRLERIEKLLSLPDDFNYSLDKNIEARYGGEYNHFDYVDNMLINKSFNLDVINKRVAFLEKKMGIGESTEVDEDN